MKTDDVLFQDRKIAYFTMEIGLEPELPTYSGGLGVLAGDTVRSFADLGVPAVAVSLLYDQGYFRQELDAAGNQSEQPVTWERARFLAPLEARAEVTVEQRPVALQAWLYLVRGARGAQVPVVLLDSNLPENSPEDRALTGTLYGGDARYRLAQEIVLGIGGLRLLEALGCRALNRYHMNEGHSSLLVVELLARTARPTDGDGPPAYDVEAVREQCVFTTHTPVPAGHDRFDPALVRRLLDASVPDDLPALFRHEGEVNLTFVALNLSGYVNGVAKRHGEVSRRLFPGYPISSITNGVHPVTWAAPAFRNLFDRNMPGWRADAFALRYALNVPAEEVARAHAEAKHALVSYVNEHGWADMSPEVLTIGFARRSARYKRPQLLFHDPGRLREIYRSAGPFQVIYAGKAHPQDEEGKELIRLIHRQMKELGDLVRFAYLEDYDMKLGRLLTAGVDLWLNTPRRPHEASGTSGMKAALNGVPSLSVLDGWWVEGHVENLTGWSVGPYYEAREEGDQDARDAADLYRKLGDVVLPMYYRDRAAWLRVMQHAIALNGSFFNTHRMVLEYVVNAYFGLANGAGSVSGRNAGTPRSAGG